MMGRRVRQIGFQLVGEKRRAKEDISDVSCQMLEKPSSTFCPSIHTNKVKC